MSENAKMEDWSKDHWSLLAYLETLVVDSGGRIGEIDREKLRCNENRHPLSAGYRDHVLMPWSPSWGTRLRGHSEESPRLLPEHDDWDCLEELEEAGLIEIISMVNGFFRLTRTGQKVAASIRAHKQEGGVYAKYELPAELRKEISEAREHIEMREHDVQ